MTSQSSTWGTAELLLPVYHKGDSLDRQMEEMHKARCVDTSAELLHPFWACHGEMGVLPAISVNKAVTVTRTAATEDG